MKKLLLIIPLMFFTLALFAQHEVSATDPAVLQVVEKYTAKYQLDEQQVAKMVRIQQRRLKNLNEIAELQHSDNAKYLQKRKAINTGTEVSIKMILYKEQRMRFDAERANIRKKKAEKTAELKAKGLNPHQMTPYLLAIEDELF
ncbi:MAG TPA: hypothetical protein ENJ45_03560 [Phaeodactylibacter sp.]|nr:hypothetical protein [Phaeodactylibacter sp.]